MRRPWWLAKPPGRQAAEAAMRTPRTGPRLPVARAGHRCDSPRRSSLSLDAANSRGYTSCRPSDILMLPNSEYRPSGLAEGRVRDGVALAVAGDFRAPVLPVSPRSREVLWTPMPEASVHEHRDARSREHEVSSPALGLERATRDAIPQPERVDRLSKGNLRARVPLAIATHDLANRPARCPRLARVGSRNCRCGCREGGHPGRSGSAHGIGERYAPPRSEQAARPGR